MKTAERCGPGTTKRRRFKKSALFALVLLLGGLLAVYWSSDIDLFPGNLTSTAGVLVLEDCDPDFRVPPYEDAVRRFGSDGNHDRLVSGLSICETVGGCRSLSVDRESRFLTVCENVGQKLSAYRLDTGEQLWSLPGKFTSAMVAQNGLVYALVNDGTIYGKESWVIDPAGRVVRQAAVGGFDLTVDADRNVLWLVGSKITKCDLELKVLLELNLVGWCAVSVDLDRDGSVWVAERQHSNVAQSTNRILQISAAGQVLRTVGLAFSPGCLRVDRSDESVWVTGGASRPSTSGRILDSIEKHTGRLPTGKSLHDYLARPKVWSRTHKYDQKGTLLCEIDRGGFSLDLDPADGSLWIGGKKEVYHYSRHGSELGRFRDGSSNQKYIAVIPGQAAATKPRAPGQRPGH